MSNIDLFMGTLRTWQRVAALQQHSLSNDLLREDCQETVNVHIIT